MEKDLIININEIINLIPHRYPFLLLDKVTKIELGKSIVGLKNVTYNEPQFTGHFPNIPIMPGVLIIEAMAQLSAVLIAKTLNINSENKMVYFMSIENAKFRKVVTPGDSIIMECSILQSRSNVWKFYGESKVENEVVAEANFTAMIRDR
jgi:3-hydroxyacyl-[acyl-carrier-protein] dehydratase